MNLSWNKSLNGKRNAAKVAKAFTEQGIENRVERIEAIITGENPRPSQRYMILAHNPGIDSDVFAARCEEIFSTTAL